MALKSEFSVKRNLLEKAFACLRGSVDIEHKISQLREKSKFLNAKNATVTESFGYK
ncbi:MAG: hypothetical protein ACYTBX_12205 [Planctomycetota bacterium]